MQTTILGATVILVTVLGLLPSLLIARQRYQRTSEKNAPHPMKNDGNGLDNNSDDEETQLFNTDGCRNDTPPMTDVAVLEDRSQSEDGQDCPSSPQQRKTQRFHDHHRHRDTREVSPDAAKNSYEHTLLQEETENYQEEGDHGERYIMRGLKIKLWLLYVAFALSTCALNSYDAVFSDFVGKIIYRGHPNAAPGSEKLARYKDGLRMAARGEMTYFGAYLVFSLIQSYLLEYIGARMELVSIHLLLAVAVAVLILTASLPAFFLSSITVGLQRGCLLTIPYVVANQIVQAMAQKARDGRSSVGFTMSMLGVCASVGCAASLPLLGLVEGMTGDLSMTLWLPAGLACLTAVLFLGVGKV